MVTALEDRMDLATWQVAVWKVADEKGWVNPDTRTFGDKIALIHSELSEALEEFRAGHEPTEVYYSWVKEGQANKPEGVGMELADAVIRILELCENEGIDLEACMTEKHMFNKTREFRHGGKAI